MIIVIPARGGSQRVPMKNIYPLSGRPLLFYTLNLVKVAGYADRSFVSTDSDAIAEVAEAEGIEVIRRPDELSISTASTESALLHVIDAVADRGLDLEWVMTLPPTSPFRSPQTLKRFERAIERAERQVDCFMSVSENRGDFWQQGADGSYSRLFPDAPRRQQDREPLFEENSAIYLSRVSALRETGLVLGRKTECIPINVIEGTDINISLDVLIAEAIISSGHWKLDGE